MNDDKFEKDIRKALEQGITAFNCKIDNFCGKYREEATKAKLGKPIRFLYYDRDHGIMKVNIKFSYTLEEIEFLEKARKLSEQNLQLVEEYMDKLLK